MLDFFKKNKSINLKGAPVSISCSILRMPLDVFTVAIASLGSPDFPRKFGAFSV